MSQLRDYRLYLDGVAPQRIIVKGRHFHILEALTDVTLKFDENTTFTRKQGQGGDLDKEFKEVWISSATGQTIKIALGYGKVRDSNAANINANVTATVEVGNDNAHKQNIVIGAGLAAQLAVANLSRKSLRVTLPSDAVGSVSLGKSGVTANSGGLLEAGSTDYIDSQGALFAFNPNSEPVTVWLMEINRL